MKDHADSSPLDCPAGLECSDFECEGRHLDEIEQQLHQRPPTRPLEGSQAKQQPQVIVTASRDMGRSASTWLFNAVRLLYRQAAIANHNDDTTPLCDAYWIRQLTAPKIRERVQFAQKRDPTSVVLIKTHEFTDYLSKTGFTRDIRPWLTQILVSVRQGMAPDPAWLRKATHVVQYEDIVQHAVEVLRTLASHLGISSCLKEEDLQNVDYTLMTLPIPGNQATKFWSFHARRGGRPVPTLPNSPSPSIRQSSTRHVFVTRHGARLDNGPDGRRDWLAKIGHGRPQDAPLSPHGHKAATELAQALLQWQEENPNSVINHIVSSPFLRCVETAQAVARTLHLVIKIEPGIAEVGSRPSHMASLEEIQARFPNLIDTTYSEILSRSQLPTNEYSDGAAARRTARVAKALSEQLSGNMLLIGHGASCLGLVQAFGGPNDYVGYCSLTQFQSKDGSKWQLVGELGSVQHLSDPQTALNSAW